MNICLFLHLLSTAFYTHSGFMFLCIKGFKQDTPSMPHLHIFPHNTLAIEAVICWPLMERFVELAKAWAHSAFTMHTDACNRGG